MTIVTEQPNESFTTAVSGYPRAPWGRRLLAFFIDSLIGCLALTVLSLLFIYVLAMGLTYQQPRFIEGLPEFVFYIWLLAVILSFIWFNIYALVRDALLKGSSPGKSICGLMVVNTHSNQPCNLISSLLRNVPGYATVLISFALIYCAFIFLLIEPAAAISNEKGLRLGDRWAKTQVIERKHYRDGES